jgi:hypothetical protein
VGSAVGADGRQVKSDLNRFKDFIENRGTESGAWRGVVAASEDAGAGGAAGMGGADSGAAGAGELHGEPMAGGLDEVIGFAGMGQPGLAASPRDGTAPDAPRPADPAADDPDSGGPRFEH